MTWIGDAWDAVSGWFGNSGSSSSSSPSWLDRNWNNIVKGIDTGRKIYNTWDVNNSRQNSRDDILSYLQQQESADNNYQKQLWEYQNANRASAAAASRANDAARRKASAKAFKQQSKMLKELIAQYQPYTDVAKELTPKMSQNYSQFLDTTGLLNQYLTPKVMETLGSAPKPSWEQGAPQAAYKVSVPQSAPISFPSLDAILKNK